MPAPKPDYGSCLSCRMRTVTLVDPDGVTRTTQTFDVGFGEPLVSGRTCLAEALVRRVVTPRGSLCDDPDYGTDLRAYLNDDVTAADVGRIASDADREYAKDERVKSSRTTATFVRGKLTLTSRIVDAAGTFRLVVAIDLLGAELLEAA